RCRSSPAPSTASRSSGRSASACVKGPDARSTCEQACGAARAEGCVMRRSGFVLGTAASVALPRTPARAAEWSYNYAHNLPVGHPLHVRTVQMWHEVRNATRGRLDVTVFPNNQLGADPSALAQLRSGAIQFFTASGGLIGSVVPLAQIENVGFAFRDAR